MDSAVGDLARASRYSVHSEYLIAISKAAEEGARCLVQGSALLVP